MSEQEDTTQYKVVLNHEEQYSIWPAERENALGWRDDGFRGAKAEVLAYIKEHWTDMRPLSLRQLMDNAQQPTATAPSSTPSSDAVGIPSAAATTVVNEPVSVTASAAPEANPAPPPEAAKERRGWFGRRR